MSGLIPGVSILPAMGDSIPTSCETFRTQTHLYLADPVRCWSLTGPTEPVGIMGVLQL